MDTIRMLHGVLGERVLPILILIAAIYFYMTWKAAGERTVAGRIFPMLIDLQAGLGLLYWLFLIFNGDSMHLGFPFLLHPLLGLIAAGLGHMGVSTRGPFARFGRWSAVVALVVLLVLVVGNAVIARQVPG